MWPSILQIKRKEKKKKKNIRDKRKEKKKKRNNDLADLPSHDTSQKCRFFQTSY